MPWPTLTVCNVVMDFRPIQSSRESGTTDPIRIRNILDLPRHGPDGGEIRLRQMHHATTTGVNNLEFQHHTRAKILPLPCQTNKNAHPLNSLDWRLKTAAFAFCSQQRIHEVWVIVGDLVLVHLARVVLHVPPGGEALRTVRTLDGFLVSVDPHHVVANVRL